MYVGLYLQYIVRGVGLNKSSYFEKPGFTKSFVFSRVGSVAAMWNRGNKPKIMTKLVLALKNANGTRK